MSGGIHTAGELRGFLAEVLIGIREKRVSPDEAGAIAKVAAEINRSLAVEIQTALQTGIENPVAGSMVIASRSPTGHDRPALLDAAPLVEAGEGGADMVWCDQCDMRVTASQAGGCRSRFCKAKAAE